MTLLTAIGFVLTGAALVLSALRRERGGKVSAWVLIPFLLSTMTLTFFLWRGIQLAQIQALESGATSQINYFLLALLILSGLITIRLLKASVDLTVKLENTSFEARFNNQSKANILHYVSHELKSPLSAVIGFSEVYIDDSQIPGELKEAFDCIYTASMHMKSVLDDLLSLSRFDTGSIQVDVHEFQVRAWINKLSKPLLKRADKQHIKLEVRCADKVPENVKSDASKLAQIVINLCENSFKFTPQEGTVNFEVDFEAEEGGKAYLVLKVSDTGRGIDQEYLAKVFEPFFQIQSSDFSQGLGLGMSICKRFIDMLGGEIHLESQVGEGTAITCKVPV